MRTSSHAGRDVRVARLDVGTDTRWWITHPRRWAYAILPTNMRTSIRLSIVVLVGCSIHHPDLTLDPDATTSPDANAAAPTCNITMPVSGSSTAFDVPVMFDATATDPKDGPLTGASVVWRTSLQAAPLGNGTTLTTMLPPGMNLVTCTATNSKSLTGTGMLIVISKSPFAQINHPGNNQSRPASQPVPFVGVGRDVTDGSLSGGSMKWTSNLDGSIGTGQTFNRTLSAGVHTITLTVTDSANKTDSASITLTMTQ